MKLAIVLSSIVAAILLQTTVASAEDVDCSKRPAFVDPKSCCPIPELITDEIKETCKEFNTPPAISAEVNGADAESDTERPRPRPHPHPHPHPRPPHHNPCFMSCALNETGIMTDDMKLDEAKLKAYLSNVLEDAEMIAAVETSFITCGAKTDDKIAKRIKNKPPKDVSDGTMRPHCHPGGSALLWCVYKKTFKNCPAKLWNDTTQCNEWREYKTNCKRHGGWGKRRQQDGNTTPASAENEED